MRPETLPFVDVARLIAPDKTPAWIAEHLERWASSVMIDRHIQAQLLPKATMRKRMAKIGEAAALLQSELADTEIRTFLESAGRIRIENLGGLLNGLKTIAERADVAARSPAIFDAKRGATKSGTGRALPPDGTSAKAFCALLIAETWKYVHGCYPEPRNLKAGEAAEAYWLACGGSSKGWGTDRREGWRPHFKDALTPATVDLRNEVKRHCNLSDLHQ